MKTSETNTSEEKAAEAKAAAAKGAGAKGAGAKAAETASTASMSWRLPCLLMLWFLWSAFPWGVLRQDWSGPRLVLKTRPTRMA
jgi:hypothetical protein